MKERRSSVSAFSLPTDQIATEARLRSRRTSSETWFSASARTAGFEKSMAQ